MPQGHLDAIDERGRAEKWRHLLDAAADADADAGRVLVVEREAAILGFAAFTTQQSGPPGEGLVTAFYVRTHAWGTGVAQVLMRETERALITAGFTRGKLSVLTGNPRARRFYEKCGWSTDGRELAHSSQQPGMPSPVEYTVVEYTKTLVAPEPPAPEPPAPDPAPASSPPSTPRLER